MTSLDIPDHVRDIFHKKRVAIVGPAGYLTGKGDGKLIDEYDIVVRPNYFALPSDMHDDYGSRTDVMYHNMASVYLSGLQEHVKKYKNEFESLKLVIGSAIKAGPKDIGWGQWDDDHVSECATNFKKLGVDSVPYWWIGVGNYKKTFVTIDRCEPYTGISSILITTSCQPSELYLTGFDFYSGSKLYAENLLASVDKAQETSNRGGGHGSGCTSKNKKWVQWWYEHCKFAKVDQHISELLK